MLCEQSTGVDSMIGKNDTNPNTREHDEVIEMKVLDQMVDMHAANILIVKVWGIGNGISPYLLMAHTQVGGIVVGAFLMEKLVGVSYGFPGITEVQELFLYSHLLAIDPDYRDLQIGTELKCFQAEIARKKGYRTIRWTFDPLESRNANLNIHKLGATSNAYKVNFYGDMKDALNAGTPTDRLLIDWQINRTGSREGRSLDHYQPVALIGLSETNSFPICKKWTYVESTLVSVPIPSNIQELKQELPELAKHWRLCVREMLMHYFQRGYVIQGFDFSPGRPVQYYLLHGNEGKEE